MRLLAATLFALTGGLAVASILPPATAQHATRAPLTESDTGLTTHVPVGTVLTVTLGHAAGTGYAWRYIAREGILPVDARTASAVQAGIAGGPVIQTFQFRTAARQANVAFALARPWEKDKPPARTVRYAIVAS